MRFQPVTAYRGKKRCRESVVDFELQDTNHQQSCSPGQGHWKKVTKVFIHASVQCLLEPNEVHLFGLIFVGRAPASRRYIKACTHYHIYLLDYGSPTMTDRKLRNRQT
jgi:hypothetical protein